MKKVWSASIGLLRINVYSIGASYDDLFDYRTYRLNEIAISQNPNHPENLILKQKKIRMIGENCVEQPLYHILKNPVFYPVVCG